SENSSCLRPLSERGTSRKSRIEVSENSSPDARVASRARADRSSEFPERGIRELVSRVLSPDPSRARMAEVRDSSDEVSENSSGRVLWGGPVERGKRGPGVPAANG